jgi:ABC-type lipoprotein export system ATPase subunit
VSTVVEAREVFHVYSTPEGDAAALQGLTLNVLEREVLVVLGPSGSGKSTLLRILAGLERPSAGRVRVFGAELGKLGGRALADYRARTLGFVEQHYTRALDPDLTARQLVALQPALAGESRRQRELRAVELLERVGLEGKRDSRPGELSGGEQQRVAVCAALAHRPGLLLADEPTGELDAASADLVYTLLGELAREHGCTTVVVSHDPESARIADRTVRVRDGRVSEEAAGSSGDETIVVGRGGWLRLPEDLLARAGIGGHARATLDAGAIVVGPAGGRSKPEPAAPSDAHRRAGDSGGGGVAAETRAVVKAFGRGPQATEVFSGLDTSFEAGKVTAVTGPSGSGKSTLLHLLAGLSLPTGGDVIVFGVSLPHLDRAARAALRRERVALIPQAPELLPFLSARENVELGLAIRGVPVERAGELARDALEAVGLAERSEQRVSRLSAGERQRVAIARALASQPALLLADEPTARLDQTNALAVGALLANLAQTSGAAVVCATHDPLLVEHADETVALRPYAAAIGSGA